MMLRFCSYTALFVSLLALLLHDSVRAESVEFNYNGRVRVHGMPFDGFGQFKFALVNASERVTYWSNDGASVAGSEPVDHIVIEVIDGFFSVTVGDTLSGMEPLNPVIFNGEEVVFLKVWFSDGVSGFEELNPKRRVVNPALLGVQTSRQTALYVDPVNGNDDNNGLTSDTAKLTLQSAWDSLPTLIKRGVEIHLLPGFYYQSATLTGKSVLGGDRIRILGDSQNPANVTFTAVNSNDVSSPTLTEALRILNQEDVSIEGVTFSDFTSWAIFNNNGSIMLVDCVFDACRLHQSAGTTSFRRCTLMNAVNHSYTVQFLGRAAFFECHFENGPIGIEAAANSVVTLDTCTFDNMSTRAIDAATGSVISFNSTAPNSTISNSPIGVMVRGNATVIHGTLKVDYIDVPTPLHSSNGDGVAYF